MGIVTVVSPGTTETARFRRPQPKREAMSSFVLVIVQPRSLAMTRNRSVHGLSAEPLYSSSNRLLCMRLADSICILTLQLSESRLERAMLRTEAFSLFGRSMLLLGTLAIAAGCGSTPVRVDGMVGTPFEDGGLSKRTQSIALRLRAEKGSDVESSGELGESLKADFDGVIAQCKLALDGTASEQRSAERWALATSIVGLISGAVIGPTLAARATISKAQVAFFSGIAGATNSLQNELRRNGFDSEKFAARNAAIRSSIAAAVEDFVRADTLSGRQGVLLRLTASCIANS